MSTVRMSFKVGVDSSVLLHICDKCGSVFKVNKTNCGKCYTCKLIREVGKL